MNVNASENICFDLEEIIGNIPDSSNLYDYNGTAYNHVLNAFLRSHHILSSGDSQLVLSSFLKAIDNDVFQQIGDCVRDVDHLGFLIPPGIGLNNLSEMAMKAGFGHDHQMFNSQIMSKELAYLEGEGSPIPTQIFKASLKQSSSGVAKSVEVFIPTWKLMTIKNWIYSGVGFHVALRVKKLNDLETIRVLLTERGYIMPTFMNNKLMHNDVENSSTLYLDFNLNGGFKRRIEFFGLRT